MIVYLETKAQFVEDVFSNRIEETILAAFKKQLHRAVGAAELNSWKNSLGYMHRVLVGPGVPDDAGVAIEFNIPQTSKRIDFIVTGLDQHRVKSAVIIELKQWEKVECTEKDAIVQTFVGGANREKEHPWS